MTVEKRPSPRRSPRPLRHLAARGLVLLAAALFSVLPTWSAARCIAAICVDRDPAPQTAPREAFNEEEEAPEAALHRHHIEIRRADADRSERAVAGESAVRHRLEWDMERAALRWSKYQAPPRAPPHRLLN
jgi:hypothetical protein